MSNSLQPHGLQHARLLCPSFFPRVCSNSCPLNRWSHPTISSSVTPFSSYPQSFQPSGSLPVSWLFASGAKLISFRIDWFRLLAVCGTLKSLLQHHSLKALILWCSAFFMVQLSHPYRTTGKTIALTLQTFVSKMMSLPFNMLSRFIIAFPPRSKCLLISWLQSPSAVTSEPKKIVCHSSHCFPIYLPWSNGTRCHDLSFLNVEF